MLLRSSFFLVKLPRFGPYLYLQNSSYICIWNLFPKNASFKLQWSGLSLISSLSPALNFLLSITTSKPLSLAHKAAHSPVPSRSHFLLFVNWHIWSVTVSYVLKHTAHAHAQGRTHTNHSRCTNTLTIITLRQWRCPFQQSEPARARAWADGLQVVRIGCLVYFLWIYSN